MGGRLPKPLGVRARTNKAVTRATLRAEAAEGRRAPPLPRVRHWNPLTRAWWRDVWRSPMAAEYLEADVHGLVLLAVLLDRFWTEPVAGLAAEIRLQRQCYGLTPIDRRRLEWEVERRAAPRDKLDEVLGRYDDSRDVLKALGD